MTFQQTLSSIFLPSTSIYASIDQNLPPSSSSPSQVIHSTSPTHVRQQEHSDITTSNDEDVIDPFESVQSTPVTKSEPLPLNPPPPPPLASEQAATEEEDPFNDDLDLSRRKEIPQVGSSSNSPTSTTPHLINQTRMQSGDESISRSSGVIGSKSLMGLLGGGGGGGGINASSYRIHEEDNNDEETREDVELSDSTRQQLVNSALRDSLLSTHPQTLGQQSEIRPYTFEDGVLEEEEEEEEEEDDEVPPDFTTRIPLLSSHVQSPLSPPLPPSSSSNRRNRTPRVVHPISPSSTTTTNTRTVPLDPPSRNHRNRNGILGHSLPSTTRPTRVIHSMSAKERALWRWVNVEDLDKFLSEVYRYYLGKGVWTIGLERVLNLLTVGWVIGFSTFLGGCVDYPKLWHADKLKDAVVPKCVSRLSGFSFLFFVLFVGFYAWRVAEFGLEVKKLWEMHEFYTELLEVPEDDIQTIPWYSIVTRLAQLRASHPSSLSSRQQARDEPLDAHSVANRIMRSQNYLVALLNAPNVLDFSLPLPKIQIVRKCIGKDGRIGQGWLTKALEWNLNWTVLGFMFDERGVVREMCLSERKRVELIKALKNRFILVGLLNALFAPFIVVYLLIYSFFRYFEEYHKNPSTLSSRQFTPLAIYKFRSFNELDHEFSLRLSQIRPLANLYLSSYPRAKTALLSRFVAFLAGSFAAVLIVFSLIDPDAFLHFEVTPGRTVLFWIGILGGVVAVARGMTPAQEGEALKARLEPGELMKEIVELSRYCPDEWEGKLHAYSVHQSFAPLFPPKPLLFLQELASVLLTPLILLFTLPNCAGNVVDFFREFTIEVEGLGRVCSFAVFDLKNDGARKPSNASATRGDAPRSRQTSNISTTTTRFRNMENKMEKSLLNFAVSNPDWQPRDEAQSLYLSQMLSDHHHPPSSTIHLPHQQQQHSSSSTVNFLRSPPPSRGHSLVRTTRFDDNHHQQIRNRKPPPPQTAHQSERAKFYDRAFQKSTLLSSTYSRRNGNGRIGGEGRIIEESRLDGESFVAPTEEMPFGLVESETIHEDGEDGLAEGERGGRGEEGGGGGRGEKRRMPNSNLGALVGELYRRQ